MELNEAAEYKPNGGRWIQTIKTDDIIKPHVVVNSRGLSFKARYPNPFAEYVIQAAANRKLLTIMSGRSLEVHCNMINFAVFCATSGLGIAQEHFRNKQPLFASLIRFHLYYHVRKILYRLEVPLPDEQAFQQLKNDYSGEEYLNVCSDYGVSRYFDWRNEYIFSTTQGSKLYAIDGDSWSRWIMPQSKGLTRQGVEMLSKSIRVYV